MDIGRFYICQYKNAVERVKKNENKYKAILINIKKNIMQIKTLVISLCLQSVTSAREIYNNNTTIVKS